MSSHWPRAWVAACLFCFVGCARDAGSFSVRFGFEAGLPDPSGAYQVSARVEDEHAITVAESASADFAPGTRLRFQNVPNGGPYTVVVELKTSAGDRASFFGRSQPFQLSPGRHTEVQVALAIQSVPTLGPRGALRIVEALESEKVGRYVKERSVTLAFSAEGASEATLANDEAFSRGKTTRRLDALSQEDGEYRWPAWDLDAEVCGASTCVDGRREVYLRLTNSMGYRSEPVRVDAILDRTPPQLSVFRLDPATAADGVETTLLLIAREPLLQAPEVSVEPDDFALALDAETSEATPGGVSFNFRYTVDARALDQQSYQFHVRLSDLAGNQSDLELGTDAQLEIASELHAVSTAVERVPTFAPFERVPVFSKLDPVSGEPVRVRVRVESSRPYADAPQLSAADANGHVLPFEHAAAESDERHAVFYRTLGPDDRAGSYQLTLDWHDRSGRAGQPDALRAFAITDAPSKKRWGVVDSGLDAEGQPRTLYISRPWGAQTLGGHRALGDSLTGRVIQHATRPEDCIAQLLIYGDADSDGTPRPASLLSVADVRGCTTDDATFSVTFSGHSDYHLYVVPVTASGHRGPAQAIEHGEWVATLPEAESGGTAAHPHRVTSHMLPPKLPLRQAEVVQLPARSTDVPYVGSWQEHVGSDVSPRVELASTAVYDANHARTLLFSRETFLEGLTIWQWDGMRWTAFESSVFTTSGVEAVAFDAARDRMVVVGGGEWSEPDADGTSTFVPANDTWEWDGGQWLKQHPEHSPEGGLVAMVYDPTRQRMVAFERERPRTWEWNGADWFLGPELPLSEEVSKQAVYDAKRRCLVVLVTTYEGGPARVFEYRDARWIERTTPQSPTLYGSALIGYDSRIERVVVYGRNTSATGSASTWQTYTWDGAQWTELASAARPPRSCFALLEEGHGRGASLFCGSMKATERWRWQDAGWSVKSRPSAPEARTGATMVYDERRRRIVLHGGETPESSSSDHETWEYDGSAWSEFQGYDGLSISFGGSTRNMIYDAARGVSLFVIALWSRPPEGGRDVEDEGTQTIAFDGSSWRQVAQDPLFPSRNNYAIAYDAARSRAVLFGGERSFGSGEVLADTWEWDGASWQQVLSATVPVARQSSAMAFDAVAGRTILFGGTGERRFDGGLSVYGDTWSWDGSAWTQLAPGQAPPARTRHALVYDAERQRVVLFGGAHGDDLSSGPLADTWEWDGSTWTQAFPIHAPPARAGHTMAYDPERKRVLLYGGDDDKNTGTGAIHYGDLWAWDGTNWTMLPADVRPGSRYGTSLTYDAAREEVVMFGGETQTGALADTWVWDGERWTQRGQASAPPPRGRAAFAYDPATRSARLHGGSATGALRDTWEWDGASWTRKQESGPEASSYAMMYDAKNERMLLVADSETFFWQGDAWQPAGVPSLAERARVYAMAYDRARERGVLSVGVYPEGSGSITEAGYEWDGTRWQDREVLRGLLTYAAPHQRILQLEEARLDEGGLLFELDDQAGRVPLLAADPPYLRSGAIAYDEAREQLVLVGKLQGEGDDAPLRTAVWSAYEPAHQVMVDLKPLFGSARTRDPTVDGLAFRALAGASASTEGEANPGAALAVWNGSRFERVVENAASFDAPGELCFESRDPATFGAIEVDKQWPFLLQAAADSDGPEVPRLQTSAFELRVRYHLGAATPALPAEPGSVGKRCAPGSWALSDLGAP
jgi:hypothetical protein